MTEEPAHFNAERRQILQLYIVFGVGLALSVIPFFLAAGLSVLLVFGALIAAYIVRNDAEKSSLTENHMTYIIRTIWIGTFFSMITITAGSIYLFRVLDNTPLDPCIQHFYSIINQAQVIDIQAVSGTFQTCFTSYMSVNFWEFMIAGAICALPVLLYFAVRYIRGLTRALNGYRIAKPDAWF